TDLSLVSFSTLLYIALHSRAIQSNVLTQYNTHTYTIVIQHTVNPLIAPNVNSFLPSVISTGISAFLLALITVLVSLGMSVALISSHPVSECPPQSRYKSL
ncbi:unnamed protein product, partial [Staurois parvus]